MNYLEKIKNKIFTKESFKKNFKTLKLQNQKIVFSNGCFDLIHRGHIDYLARAKNLGDILIIGLNTDISVRNLKGEKRPIQDEYSRAFHLSSFCFVDYVIFFSEETPYNLIKIIKPNILVKGSDYKKEDIVGYDIVNKNGGEIITLDFIDGFSTSKIIEKIKSN